MRVDDAGLNAQRGQRRQNDGRADPGAAHAGYDPEASRRSDSPLLVESRASQRSGDSLEHDDMALLEDRVERAYPRLVRVADQEISAIDACRAAVVRIGGAQLAAGVLLVGIVCVRREAIYVDDDVFQVDREIFAGAEIRLYLLEADDVRDRLTNV